MVKKSIPETELLHLANREDWRNWLARNYHTAAGIWLVYPKKHTGKPRIPYNDAVEEALCFGWIDSTVRSLDEDRFAQHFSPRGPKAAYSQANIERLRALVSQGRVIPEVLAGLPDLDPASFVIPPDILAAIQADAQAWVHFQAFSPAYIRIRIAFIDGARRRPDEFNKRLRHFIAMTAKNKQFGFGGIEKYY